MAAYSFVDLREAISKIDQLAASVDALTKRPEPAADPSALVGQLVKGALSVIDQRIAQFEQQFAEHKQQMALAAQEIRASVPQMPEFAPLVTAMEGLVQQLDAAAARAPETPPGVAELTQSVTGLQHMVHEMCTRMDKPVVREGVADLPSGQVKLRVVETRQR